MNQSRRATGRRQRLNVAGDGIHTDKSRRSTGATLAHVEKPVTGVGPAKIDDRAERVSRRDLVAECFGRIRRGLAHLHAVFLGPRAAGLGIDRRGARRLGTGAVGKGRLGMRPGRALALDEPRRREIVRRRQPEPGSFAAGQAEGEPRAVGAHSQVGAVRLGDRRALRRRRVRSGHRRLFRGPAGEQNEGAQGATQATS